MSKQPYAFKILEQLYFLNDKGLNIKEIYYIFNNANSIKVRKTIKLLAALFLIQMDINKSKKTEKRYFITSSGRQLVSNHYIKDNK